MHILISEVKTDIFGSVYFFFLLVSLFLGFLQLTTAYACV